MASENKTLRRGIELYIDGKEVKANMKQVEAEAKKLREEIRGMTVGSKEYFEATKRYRELDAVLREHRAGLRAVEVQHESLLSKGVRWFKEYSLQITGAIAALTGVAMKLNQLRKQAYEKEDAAANLKALTGLDDENIQWLTQQAEKISTSMDETKLRVRKSATEILEAYMLVGSAKPELLKDKEALNAVTIEAMRLAEAAKMELKDSVDAVTIALNQYNAGADQAIRFTNVLAAGSKYGAANVQAQAAAIKNSGVAAASAGLSIEQHVGIIEMLAEKGIKAEEAGTALKGVFLKLQTGADDTNPAIVGLDKALENLAAKGMSAGEILNMFDRRGFNAAKILIDNTEKVKEYTTAVTDTSVAVEQAAINSDTAAAKMAQIRNQLNLTGQELAKTLAPVFSLAVGWTRKFIMAMPPVIDFMKKYGKEILIISAYLLVLSTYQKAVTLWTTFWASVTASVKAYSAAMILARDAVVGCSLATTRLTALMAAQNIVTKAVTATAILLKTAYYGLTLQFTAASRSLAAFNAVAHINPFAVVITAITAVTYAYVKLVEKVDMAAKKMKEWRKIQQQATESTQNERNEIKRLSDIIHNSSSSYNARKKAIEDMQKIVPDYHASLTTEGKLINDNVDAIERYVKAMTLQAQSQAATSKLVEAQAKQEKWYEDNKKRVEDMLLAEMAYKQGLMEMPGSEKYDNPEQAAMLLYGMSPTVYRVLKSQWNALEGEAKMYQGMLDEIEAKLSKIYEEGANASGSNTEQTEPTPPTSDEKDAERQKRIREALETIDTEYNKRAADLKQKFLDGEFEKEEEYAAKVQALELERLQKKMDVVGLEPKKQDEIRLKILDIKQKLTDELRQLDFLEGSEEERRLNEQLEKNRKAAQDRLNILEKAKAAELLSEEDYNKRKIAILDKRADDDRNAYEKMAESRLAASRKALAKEISQLEKQRAEELKAEKKQDGLLMAFEKLFQPQKAYEEEYSTVIKYDSLILEAKKKFYETLLQDQSLSNEQREQLQLEYNRAVLESVEKRNSELEEKNKQMFDMLNSAGQEIGKALADILTDSEKSFADFMKELVKTVLDAIEKLLIAYVAETTMRNVAELGFLGLAKAAAEIAIITAAFEAAKAAIGGFEAGGFTPEGEADEPQGIVHSNEFVANRFAVKNPQVLPVLQLIDAAQRSGNISNLTGQQIAAVATGNVSTPQNTRNVSSAPIAQQTIPPELTRAINMLIYTTRKAAEAYKEPALAYTFADGKGGVNEAQELLDRMKKNASLKS